MNNAADILGEVESTERGFEVIRFKDRNGVPCALQQSSVYEYESPGSSAVWLGTAKQMHLSRTDVIALTVVLNRWIKTGSFKDE